MDKEFEEKVDGVLDLLGSVLKNKNRDYGCSVFRAGGLVPSLPVELAMYVRIGDKINRLRNLLGGEADRQEQPATRESIDDTILDLAGYLVLLLIWRMREQEV